MESNPIAEQSHTSSEIAELRELAQIVLRRRWAALGVFLAIVTVGIIHSIRTPRIYRSSAVILINQRTPEFLGREVQGFSGADNSAGCATKPITP